MSGQEGLPDWARDALLAIGLAEPDVENPLHVRLVNAVLRLGPGAPLGRQLTAMRFEFAWELSKAGEAFAKAKTDYEHKLASKKARLMLGEGFSGVKAQAIAEGDDEVYELVLAYRVAEQRERAMRKFLDAIEAAGEVWRTLRADERAADRQHSQGFGGGA